MTRMYHVVVIVERTGRKVYMTATPVTHKQGCTILSKLTRYPWRREQIGGSPYTPTPDRRAGRGGGGLMFKVIWDNGHASPHGHD
jgi:hypothetical protein